MLAQKQQIKFDHGFGYGLRVLKVMLSHPTEAIDRIRGRFELVREANSEPEPVELTGDRDWDRQVHEALGYPWPCDQTARFQSIWNDLSRTLEGQPLGSGHDADMALTRALVPRPTRQAHASRGDRRRPRHWNEVHIGGTRSQRGRPPVEHRPAADRNGMACLVHRGNPSTSQVTLDVSERLEPASPSRAPPEGLRHRSVRARQSSYRFQHAL